MNIRHRTLPSLIMTTALVLAVSGCSKKETAPSAPAATPAAAPAASPATTPQAAAPAKPTPTEDAPAAARNDPLKSMVGSATKAAETAAAQVQSTPVPTAPAAPAAPSTPAPSAQSTPTSAPSTPASLTGGLTAMQGSTAATPESAITSLAASTGDIQKQAEELLTRYSGELSTLKSGALAVKTYVDQHPELLPEAAKSKYQQLNAMVPQLETLVGTLKDYKSADLTTLVPKLQNDFAKAKSLYTEVRSLLPATL